MRWILDCIYLAVGACLLPYWLWKLPEGRRYRAGLLQRLGFAPEMPGDRRRLWIHCASVGEASIPRALVAEFRRQRPQWQVVFSTNTDTGADRLRELYPGAPVFHMPLDFSFCVREALRRVRPAAMLLVELEVWPNLLDACRRRSVPVGIVNGRIGSSSRRALRGLSRLLPGLWDPVRVVCARSRDDAEGFVSARVPAERVCNVGSLKYDVLPDEPNREREQYLRRVFNMAPGTPVLVAGSTHQGEEAMLAAAYRDLKLKHRDLQLILVPRHVERAAEVMTAVRACGFSVKRMSLLESGREAAEAGDVILVDTIGDLAACYGLATCAFVGRSLIPPGGGQNMMEPAVLGKPVLVGPHTGNFKPEMALLSRAGAVSVVRERAQLAREINLLLSDPRRAERMGNAGRGVVRQSRGATQRTLHRLQPLFDEAS